MHKKETTSGGKRSGTFEDRFLRIATPLLILCALYLFMGPESRIGNRVGLHYERYRLQKNVAARWSELVQASFPLYSGDDQPELIIFSDFECPFCIANVPAIDSALLTGTKISYYHSPADHRVRAREAAMISVCAAKIGRFSDAYNYYIREIAWKSGSDSVPIPPALDTEQLRACLRTEEPARVLDASVSMAHDVGVTGTPTFATGRRVHVGLLGFEALQLLSRNEK